MTTDRNYWIHRISHIAHISYPLIHEGYLSYGWSDFAEDGFIENVREKGWSYFEDRLAEWNWPTNRHQLWRFITTMKRGDWVLVPSYGSFSIYELMEDAPLMIADIRDITIKNSSGMVIRRDERGYLLDDQGEYVDLGFARRVKAIAVDIPRASFADSKLISRLKVRQTNVNITDLENSVLDAYERYQHNRPLDFRKELDDLIPSIQKRIIEKLDDVKFERLVQWYLEKAGATYTEIPPKNGSNKQGYEDVDVIASFDQLKMVIYVQVKHHRGSTDDWATQQIRLLQTIHEGENTDLELDNYNKIYWVITSADCFTEKCVDDARKQNIQLIDGKTFASMLLDVGFDGVNKAF